MVGGKRRKSRRGRVLGSHQKCWLYGRHVVRETLRAGRWPPLELWLADDLEDDVRSEATTLATRLAVPIVQATSRELTRRCGGLAHQGLMARMPPFPYADSHDVLQSAAEPVFFVILDGVQDPFNFGAILRCADVLGASGAFVATTNQSEVTVQVARSSAGAVNYVPLAQVPDLVGLIRQMQQRRIRVVAAAERAEKTLADCDFRGPCALVVGNEGFGVRAEVLNACDQSARIPQSGHVSSLNAAAAAAILFYEVRRQRGAPQAAP